MAYEEDYDRNVWSARLTRVRAARHVVLSDTSNRIEDRRRVSSTRSGTAILASLSFTSARIVHSVVGCALHVIL